MVSFLPYFAKINEAIDNFNRKIDELLYPPHATPYEERVRRQQSIEHNGNLLRDRIAGCASLQESYMIHDLINDFRNVWGWDDNQVKGHYYSLFVQLHNKQEDIINKL
jgi:hypothetical protein